MQCSEYHRKGFLKYTRQIYHTPAPINIEFDASWRGSAHGADSFYVYLFPSTSAIDNNTEGLRIRYFTYNGQTNFISFTYNNANNQSQNIPTHSIISENYQKFRILITQEGLIHLYKNNTEILDNNLNPVIGNFSQPIKDNIINDLSNINKQSIMFRTFNGDAFAQTRIKNVTISNHNTYNSIVKDENNNLGIGTSSPLEKLHVNGNIIADGNNSSISMSGSWVVDSYHKIMGHNNAKKLEFNYNDGTILADNNAIIFKAGYNSSNQTHTERMRINNNGNVVIKSNVFIGENTNPFESNDTSRLHFGATHSNDNYYIGTNKEDYGGHFTKLDIRWHTGVRIGAKSNYGGVRIYNHDNLDSANLLLSIGKNSFNTIVENGNLNIKNGHIYFGENPTVNSFDNIIFF